MLLLTLFRKSHSWRFSSILRLILIRFRTNGRRNERMNEWTNDQMNERTNNATLYTLPKTFLNIFIYSSLDFDNVPDERKIERMKKRTNERSNERTNERTNNASPYTLPNVSSRNFKFSKNCPERCEMGKIKKLSEKIHHSFESFRAEILSYNTLVCLDSYKRYTILYVCVTCYCCYCCGGISITIYRVGCLA